MIIFLVMFLIMAVILTPLLARTGCFPVLIAFAIILFLIGGFCVKGVASNSEDFQIGLWFFAAAALLVLLSLLGRFVATRHEKSKSQKDQEAGSSPQKSQQK